MPTTRTLMELVVCVHFDSPLNIGLLDIAAWASEFSAEFSIAQDLQPHPRVELNPENIQFDLVPQLPRLMLRSPATQLSMQLQADRFAIGWAKQNAPGIPEIYPGYEEMRANWSRLGEIFYHWHERHLGGTPDARLIELSYVNAAPLKIDGQSRKISEIFKFINPTGRPLNEFTTTWGELLEPDANSARVTANVGIGMIPSGLPVLGFNFSGLSPAQGSGIALDTLQRMDGLHERIIDMYRAAIISEAL